MYIGIILHTLAKCAFIAGSYIIHFFLGKYLPATEYGIVGTIITIINFEYLLLNNGVRQAISNAISQEKYDNKNIVKKGMIVQVILVLVIVGITLTFSDMLGKWLGDANLSKYIRITTIIVPFMGIYFAILGIFNGIKHFIIEASILIVYPILKLAVIPCVLFIFDDAILGTEAGFIFAAITIMLICIFVLYTKRNKIFTRISKIEWKKFVKSCFSFSIIFIVASILMNIDLLIVKAFSNDSSYAGYYTGAINFAKIPYFLLNAIFIVMLPVITSLYAQEKYSEAKTAIVNILESILSMILPIVVALTASGNTLLKTFYSEEYAAGTNALRFLVFGTFFLGVSIVLNIVISATGKKRFTTILFSVLLVTDILLCLIFTKTMSIQGAALSLFICAGISMLLSLIYVSQIFGGIFSIKQLKVVVLNVIAFGMIYILNSVLNINSLITLFVFYVVIYSVILGVQLLFKLIDIKTIKNNLRNRG